jgi:hypothetical protein
MPPEIANAKSSCNYEKSGIWAVGMIIYNSIVEFKNMDTRYFKKINFINKIDKEYDVLKDILNYMIDENPNNRKSTKELLDLIKI